ncbi:3-oxoacyl-[acyl-carrier-protein] synthase III C-terminal domain-containing protein [Herbivorax sp. ANBcel31]|uniref:3-oxoacyl-ACP synthase III family protein n=1 Tax=Herbivorax sp. ANBcel31 TaxID=3069754 RepID=UPI0027AFC47D|nr:3-oxoacyl-[acyl-carrier-protein] synthase III C-terminal domain-containing protein [Herbivorax sp. ANBcel31]MDQ2086123.1 3-oxoacyl-[acyl-carrier-protein] synthase III C-terminal domain-containing protein [Herbivorax sp. ANBcel31]
MSNLKVYFPKNKRKNISRFCKILHSASFFPKNTLTNEEIIKNNSLSFKSNIIEKTVGVKTRHVADESYDDSDVLLKSAKKCLDMYSFCPDNLSRIIVNKYYGDNLLPMTASRLQGKLESNVAMHSFDVDGGISSFLHSVDLISRYISTGDEYILLSSGGIHTKLINKKDPRVAFLFGDASASLLFGVSEKQHILASYFYSNYEYYDLATSVSPLNAIDGTDETVPLEKSTYIYDTYKMDNWKKAEDFYREATAQVADNLLQESGLKMNDIDLVLVTENNKKIWELTLETLGVSQDKSISLLNDCGNTMSAMLPLLIDKGIKSGKIVEGMNVMMISHGEGISGGGIIYKF